MKVILERHTYVLTLGGGILGNFCCYSLCFFIFSKFFLIELHFFCKKKSISLLQTDFFTINERSVWTMDSLREEKKAIEHLVLIYLERMQSYMGLTLITSLYFYKYA